MLRAAVRVLLARAVVVGEKLPAALVAETLAAQAKNAEAALIALDELPAPRTHTASSLGLRRAGRSRRRPGQCPGPSAAFAPRSGRADARWSVWNRIGSGY